jgi:hypothetical protein
VAGRVDQVEEVVLPILRAVDHANGMALDGDAALALEIHGVEYLLAHLLVGERTGVLQQTVGERRLTVVDVRDDAKVANAFLRKCHLSANVS